MPTSNSEASAHLRDMADAAGLGSKRLGRHLGVNPLWVLRRLNGTTGVNFDDYHLIENAIKEMASAELEAEAA